MIVIMLCIFFLIKVVIAIGIKIKKSGKYNVYKYKYIV